MRQFAILACLLVSLGQTLVAGPTNSLPSNGIPKKNEVQQIIDETAKLPPAERDAKLKALKEKSGLTPEVIAKQQAEFRKMSPEQRTAKLKGRLTELRSKKATSTLSPSEQQQLKTLEDWSNRSQHATNRVAIPIVSTNKPSKTK